MKRKILKWLLGLTKEFVKDYLDKNGDGLISFSFNLKTGHLKLEEDK